jgi:predicted nucleotidyltransferase
MVIAYFGDTLRMGETDIRGELSFEELCGIVAPIAKEHGVIRVYLFGSRARGDNLEDSDFDFFIAVPKEFDLMDIGGFYCDLKEAIGTNVDMVWEDNMQKRPLVMEEILRDRKLVFEA